MEMVECQEAPSHGKKIYGNLTAARHAPSKKVRYTRYYRFLRCAFLSVKQNYGKIRPRRAAVVCLPMSNLFSISKILSVTVMGIWWGYDGYSNIWLNYNGLTVTQNCNDGNCKGNHPQMASFHLVSAIIRLVNYFSSAKYDIIQPAMVLDNRLSV